MELIKGFELNHMHFESDKKSTEFIIAQKKLLTHVSNKDNYRTNQYKVFSSVEISDDFELQNRRRSYFISCKFSKAHLKSVGFTGSYFMNCEFIDCIMNFGIFDNCFFYDCKISYSKTTNILAASFCNSIFRNSEFNNCYLISSSLTGIDCMNIKFVNCCFDGIIWENAKFTDSVFENVKLENLNIEFVYFENTNFVNTMLPFASIPFAFKCLEYIIDSTNDIRISSETSVTGISRQEYIDLIPFLINFYMYTNNFFPLANILTATNKLDDAYNAIKQGIIFSIKIHEYRTLKYFSELMKRNNFSGEQKSEIYELINTEINKQAMALINTYNANTYLYEIRDNLLNNREQAYVTFEMYTNIKSKTVSKTNILINTMESIIAMFSSKSNHYIEFRHNSPFQFLVTFFSDAQNIILLITTIYMAYKGFNRFHNDILDKEQKILNIEKTKEEINQMKKGGKLKEYEKLLYRCENRANKIKRILYNNEIKIECINHNVFNVDIKYFGDNFQEYNLK